ncbi:MAG TPA: peptidylprolyl isomerase [Galbitalea sp.]|jgi:peptidyl-prolyl cis-trans isomerase A (cyclophilin A)
MSLHTAVATIHTNKGDIVVNLYGNHAPKTVKNFVGLATGSQEWTHPATGKVSNEPLYDGVIFHRIIKDFMLQAGDPLGQGTGGPGYNFDDEISPELNFNEPYVLAMANAGLRGGHGTNGSQFFVTTVPTQWLQGKHTIFGAVADDASKKVVDDIEAVDTDGRDKPLTPVVINSIDVVEV